MSRPACTRLVVTMIASTAACSEPNQAPFSCGATPPQTVAVGDSISFLPCFTDPDADPLTISAEVAHHLQVHAATSVSGETVTIRGKHERLLLLVTVTATDPAGLYAMEEVEVTVRGLHDLAVLEAWPDSQTVQDGRIELSFVYGNVGETHARFSEWTVRVSSDSVITTADPIYYRAIRVELRDMPPGARHTDLHRFTNHPDPGEPYFGLCGVSRTPEYNLANNCSKGLKVVFPETTAERIRHSSSSSSHEVIVHRRQRSPNTKPR